MTDERILAENIRVSNDTRITKLNNNDLIIGSSGCGKTGGYVIPNIQNTTGSLIVSDTKGQLHKMFKDELESKGYKVYALDLVNPLASCGWNPIRSIRMYPDDSYYEQDMRTEPRRPLKMVNFPLQPDLSISERGCALCTYRNL